MENRYQIIILKLSDGREVKAAVPAFCEVGDKISLTNIKITEPRKMADGYSWSSPKSLSKDEDHS